MQYGHIEEVRLGEGHTGFSAEAVFLSRIVS